MNPIIGDCEVTISYHKRGMMANLLSQPIQNAMNPLDVAFFDRDAETVAKDLLGKVLCVQYQSRWLKARIIETESYYIHEKGSHASLGWTQKRHALFMPPGTIYMYYSRGGDSLNISCRGAGNAVLIKSGFPFIDMFECDAMLAMMQQLNPAKNGTARPIHKLCAGQSLLCKSLGLKVKVWDQQSFDHQKFYIADAQECVPIIVQTTRLGIAIDRDAHLPLRFIDYRYRYYCTKKPGMNSDKIVNLFSL